MTKGFKNYANAARMRDIITTIAEDAIRRLRPDVFIGEVYNFNFNALTADVRLPGHTEEQLVRVRYSADRVPRSSVANLVGPSADIVRIGGKPGNFYVIDYVRGTPQHVVYETAIVPIGTILPYGAAIAPSGFLLCNGAFVQQTQYPSLFIILGHNFNRVSDIATDPGDGTFKLPDMRNRIPYGYDPAVGALNTDWDLGSNDENTVMQDRKNRFPHSHDHTIPSQTMTIADTTPTTGVANRVTGPASHNHGGATGSASALTSGNFHAWQAVNYIIKH